jgi:hypothetical protein
MSITNSTIYTVGSNGTSITDITMPDTFWSTTTTNTTSPYIFHNGNSNTDLVVSGDAKFDGDISIKGKKLSETLDKIEERLALLTFNDELEEKWENLKGLRKAYMDLEKEILEKQKAWNILKK